MIIIALTDLHAKTGIIASLADQLCAADLVLLCGDITHFGRRKEMAAVIGQIRTLNPALYAVSGNCDHPEAEKYLTDEGLSLNGTFREFMGYSLAGLSGSLPCPGRTPNEYAEEEYEAILGGLTVPEGRPFLLVSHQPPFGTINDRVSPGLHVGSKTIRAFIEKHQPLLCFTGHIHEGQGIDHIHQTTVVNPGPAAAGGHVVAEIEGSAIKKLTLTQPL